MPFEKVVPAPFRNDAPAPEAPTIDELMTVRIARMLDNESFASAGAVSPLGNVAYRLAKATHAPHLFIGTFSCGHVDVAPGTMTLTLLEAMDSSSAVAHCGGDDTYSTYYQPGIVTHEIIGAAQIDARGRTNNLELTKPSGGKLRLPGQGGMSDVANMHRDYVVYVPRHSRAALVESVEMVSSARGVISAEARRGGRLSARRHLARHQSLRLPLRRGGRAARRGRDDAGRQPRDNLRGDGLQGHLRRRLQADG